MRFAIGWLAVAGLVGMASSAASRVFNNAAGDLELSPPDGAVVAVTGPLRVEGEIESATLSELASRLGALEARAAAADARAAAADARVGELEAKVADLESRSDVTDFSHLALADFVARCNA